MVRIPVGILRIEGNDVSYRTDDEKLAEGLKTLFADGTRLQRFAMTRDEQGQYQEHEVTVTPDEPSYLGALMRRMPHRYTVEVG